MTALGADYSWARPGGAALAAAGVKAVGRYLASDGRGITAAEYQNLTLHGVGVWVCREGAATGMLNGYGQGVADANAALRHIAAVGLPANIPVHWTADFDIGPGSPRIAQAESYVDGWNTVIPAGRRAGYGGLWFLNYIQSRGKIEFLWECASTSFRHGVDPSSVHLHLQQTTNPPPLPGTDHNYIYDGAALAGGGAVIIQEDDLPYTEEQLAKIVHDQVVGVLRAPEFGTDAQAAATWDYTTQDMPGHAWQVLRDARQIARGDDIKIDALIAAVTALSSAAGADPAAVVKAVTDAVDKKLADLKITIS